MKISFIMGLSPRVRGNHEDRLPRHHGLGSIPACAGEPSNRDYPRASLTVYPRVCGGTEAPGSPGSSVQGLSPRVRGNQRSSTSQYLFIGSIPACAGEPSGLCGRGCIGRVYPRVCGGTAVPVTEEAPPEGLSPRVRGNLKAGIEAFIDYGSIPACAGEPGCGAVAPSTCRVYPRVCGGTNVPTGNYGWEMGLSPRVRGNRDRLPGLIRRGGSIPACAGEPVRATPRAAIRWVYPRVCGGTSPLQALDGQREGLSPRVRGNLLTWVAGRDQDGSIPACAGEPIRSSRRSPRARVYPRVCGGTDGGEVAERHVPGLSPRVRGNPRVLDRTPLRVGSIPACAGEPASMRTISLPDGVYPRVCGGTPAKIPPTTRAAGLSPRVRGNQSDLDCPEIPRGSIPACAGEPESARPSTARKEVYPRVCGGTPRTRGSMHCGSGLSPRVRGNRLNVERLRGRARSIPACAGEPRSRS